MCVFKETGFIKTWYGRAMKRERYYTNRNDMCLDSALAMGHKW